MSFSLSASNFSRECYQEQGGTQPPMIRLICSFEGVKLFDMTPERGVKAKKWLNLADACIDSFMPRKAYLDYGPSNGECCISVFEGTATFEVAKFGDGNGGSLTIEIPARACLKGFKDAARIVEEWMNPI